MTPLETIQANTVDLIGKDRLEEMLAPGSRPMRVKLGVDPTRPDLTFGHMVVFNKLRQFQELGHTAVLIIGDFTTLIGDPSGRSELRPTLTRDEIEANAETYLEQAFKVLRREQTEVRRNSEWFDRMGFEDCLKLARRMTVARMLERDDFARRYAASSPISIVEFLYPLVQGHDSVEVRADVEMGGTDQLFNLLVGRQLQKDAGQPEQVVLTMPLLVGLDGVDKMSKSKGNYIAFNDSPREMFGKIMSISDEAMWEYCRLLLLTPPDELKTLRALHPMEVKKQLAVRLVDQLNGEGQGLREREQFEKVFSQNQTPDEMPEFVWAGLTENNPERLINLLGASGLFPSKKEARRLVEQGAVRIDGRQEPNPNAELTPPSGPEGFVIQAGKRIFMRVRKA